MTIKSVTIKKPSNRTRTAQNFKKLIRIKKASNKERTKKKVKKVKRIKGCKIGENGNA